MHLNLATFVPVLNYEPNLCPIDPNPNNDRSFTFETRNLKLIDGWKEAVLIVAGSYYTHKGKIKKFKINFKGSSNKELIWTTLEEDKKTVFLK